MHLLIPYIHLRNHPDPTFDEFTYGDERARARKLRSALRAGDFIFFHTTRNNKKYITAYYVVDRILDTVSAIKDRTIRDKYKNPHLREVLEGGRSRTEDDVVVFGDPIRSRVLAPPLLLDRRLAATLSLNIRFPPTATETQAIGRATRAWRQLTEEDKNWLLEAIRQAQESRPALPRLSTTEEVAEIIEKHIEDYLASNPTLVGEGLRLAKRQLPNKAGRIDLLFEDNKGDQIVVELKLGRIGRDAVRQLQRYLHELRQGQSGKVSGVIVCSGVMPAFEADIRTQQDIRILVYGWELGVRSWQ